MSTYDPIKWSPNITGVEKEDFISLTDPFAVEAQQGTTVGLDGFLEAAGGQIHYNDVHTLAETIRQRSNGQFDLITGYEDGYSRCMPFHVITLDSI